MKRLNKLEIKQLDILNNHLKIIEERIYNICLEQNQIALKKMLKKEHNIQDYKIEAEINYLAGKDGDNCLIATSTVNMKDELMCDVSAWGIGYRHDYNITKNYQKNSDLNSQKHCSLMVCLYEFHKFNWEKIFCVNNIYFNVNVRYKYNIVPLKIKNL